MWLGLTVCFVLRILIECWSWSGTVLVMVWTNTCKRIPSAMMEIDLSYDRVGFEGKKRRGRKVR